MKNGRVVGTVYTQDVSHDDVLGMIIGGVMPKNARPAQVPLPQRE